jgi:hypothetical protein
MQSCTSSWVQPSVSFKRAYGVPSEKINVVHLRAEVVVAFESLQGRSSFAHIGLMRSRHTCVV